MCMHMFVRLHSHIMHYDIEYIQIQVVQISMMGAIPPLGIRGHHIPNGSFS